MGLYISRKITKVLSWFVLDFLTNMVVYFIFLMASALSAFICLFAINILVNILDLIFKELEISKSLDLVSLFTTSIMPLIFIFTFIFCSLLYSQYVDMKFFRPDKSWWWGMFVKFIFSSIIIYIILIWLKSSNGPSRGGSLSEPLAYLCIIIYFILLVLLAICILLSAWLITSLFQRQQYNYWIATYFESARSAVDKLLESNGEQCLFGWGDIPGKDSEKLASYFREARNIGWVGSKNICKSDDGKAIHISEDEKLIKITIDEIRERGTMELDNVRICDLKVKKENDKLNIYEATNYKDMYRIYGVSDNYKSGLNVIKDLLKRGIYLNRNSNLNKDLDQLAFWMQYYLFYGGYEQIESVKKHLDHVPKNFDKQYHINSDQFVCEILRMHGEIGDYLSDYLKKNKIDTTHSTGFAYRLTDRLLKKSPEIAVVVITIILIYILRSLPYILEWFTTKFSVPFP